MPSDYTGSGTTVHVSAPLPIDSDRPAAQLWRTPYERIFDSLAALSTGTGVGVTAIKTTGGTFTLTANVVIDGGAGPFEWQFADTVRVLSGASLTVASGAELDVVSGGTIDLDGTLDIGGDSFVRSGVTFTVRNGATLEVEDNGGIDLAGDLTVSSTGNILLGNLALFQVQSGGVAEVSSGGLLEIESGGTAQLARGQDLTVTSESISVELMTPSPNHIGGDVAWEFVIDSDASPTSAYWLQSLAGTPRAPQIYPIVGRAGDIIDSFSVAWNGDIAGAGAHAGLPGTMPTVRLIEVSASGAVTVVASVTDTSASVGVYETTHSLSVSSIAKTISGSTSRLYLTISGEAGANAEAAKAGYHRVVLGVTRNSVVGTGAREFW